MNRVALLTPALSMDDAVSNDVLGQYRALRAHGVDVRIFAAHHGAIDPNPHRPEKLHSFLGSDSTLIYHLSIGWDPGKDLFRNAPGRRIIKYHNVTPPQFFARFSKEFETSCTVGRKEVARLKELPCHRFWGDSSYNCADLQENGVSAVQCDVVPPFHQVDRLESIDAETDLLSALDDGKTNILMVGRMAPNKGHAAALAAFATYYHDYDCRSRMLLVGPEDPRLNTYTQALRRQARQLGVAEAVEFIGKASTSALKSYYMMSHILLVTSEHEGFCVPLIEAMSMKVPVVALDTTAVGETLGGAGIAWPTFDAGVFAETLHRLASDEYARQAVGLAGWRRYHKCFSSNVLTDRFLTAIREAA